MQPSRKELRPYQVRLVTDVCRAGGDVLVEQPTGSGKTVQIVTLVAMHLGRRFTHAVIAAPQEQIEQGFVQRDYQTVAFPDCPGVAVPAVAVPEELIWGARQSELGSVKRLIAYLRQPALDHALACTHAALNRLTDAALPADLSGKALFIDEAHHASADGLSQIVSIWRERGGQLFFFTATPYRGDGRPVALDGMRLFRRSLAEHMAEGFAPRHLESEIVALGQPGDADHGRPVHRRRGPAAVLFRRTGRGDLPPVGGGWQAEGDCPRAADAGRQRGPGQPPDPGPRRGGRPHARRHGNQGGGQAAVPVRPEGREGPDARRHPVRRDGGHPAGAGGNGLAGLQRGLLRRHAGLAEHGGPVPGPGDAAQGRGLPRRTARPGPAGLLRPLRRRRGPGRPVPRPQPPRPADVLLPGRS